MRNDSCKKPAFSLFEVVVAIAIFAVTASILLSAIGNAYAVQNAFLARDTLHEDRRELLREILALAQNESDKLSAGGDYKTGAGETIQWHAGAEETAQAGLFRLDIAIQWGGDAGTEQLVFYTFRPAWKSQFNDQESLLENLRETFPKDRFDSF